MNGLVDGCVCMSAAILDAEQPRLVAAACKAVGLIGLQCVLPIENGQEVKNSASEATDNRQY